MQQKQKKLGLLHFIFSCHFILAYLGNPFQHSFWVVGLPAQKRLDQNVPGPSDLHRRSPFQPPFRIVGIQPTYRATMQPPCNLLQGCRLPGLQTHSKWLQRNHYVTTSWTKAEALPKQSRQWLTIPEATKFRDLRRCSVSVFTFLGMWSMMKFILNSIGFSLVLVSTACLDQNGTPVWQVRKVTWNVCNAKAKLLAVVTWSAALGPCAAAQSEKEADKRSAKDRPSPTVLRPPTIHDFPVRTGKVQNKYEMARWFCHGFGQLLWNHDKSTCIDHHESFWRIMNPHIPGLIFIF